MLSLNLSSFRSYRIYEWWSVDGHFHKKKISRKKLLFFLFSCYTFEILIKGWQNNDYTQYFFFGWHSLTGYRKIIITDWIFSYQKKINLIIDFFVVVVFLLINSILNDYYVYNIIKIYDGNQIRNLDRYFLFQLIWCDDDDDDKELNHFIIINHFLYLI